MLTLDTTAEDGRGVTGDFQTRRSGRQHMAPLEYWRGERVQYRPGQHQAIIKEIIRVPEDPVMPLGAAARKRYQRAGTADGSTRGGRGRGKSHSRGVTGNVYNPHEGDDDNTDPQGVVKDYATGQEVERRESFSSSLSSLKDWTASVLGEYLVPYFQFRDAQSNLHSRKFFPQVARD